MGRYDNENFLSDLQAVIVSNLDAKISALNTEKGDSVLSSFDSNAIFIQEIYGTVANYDPFVLIYIEDMPLDSAIGGAHITGLKLNVLICFCQNNDSDRYKRIFRYQRAIYEVIEEKYNNIFRGVKVKLSNLTPVALASENAQIFDAVGVGLEITMN